MYYVFKKSLVTQKFQMKIEELYKKAAKQCVLSCMRTEYGLNKHHDFTEYMGMGSSIRKKGCREPILTGN